MQRGRDHLLRVSIKSCKEVDDDSNDPEDFMLRSDECGRKRVG